MVADGIVTGVDRDSVAAPTTTYPIGETAIRFDDRMGVVTVRRCATGIAGEVWSVHDVELGCDVVKLRFERGRVSGVRFD